MKIRTADTQDHKAIVQVSKRSPATRDFTNQMFSGDSMYQKGWILVAEKDEEIVGFVCVRHKVRQPETSLYFLGVLPDWKRKGVARKLLEEIKKRSPHRKIVIGVFKDNEEALAFWKREGFTITSSDHYKGKGYKMELTW